MTPIVVNESENLDKARALLHCCYLEHLEWEIAHGNPSGIAIQKKNNKAIIADDYDDLSAWFSVLECQEAAFKGKITPIIGTFADLREDEAYLSAQYQKYYDAGMNELFRLPLTTENVGKILEKYCLSSRW